MSQPSPKTIPKVVCTIPCFNVERFIGGVVSRARQYVDQVIVINDGSLDSTAGIAQAAGAIVINHSVNKGAGEATKSCFEEAKRRSAHILVTLDGDGQHDPDEIPRVLAPILRGKADLVVGSRFLGSKTNMPRYRRCGIYIITFLYNFGSRVKVSDAQSCFRAYGEKALRTLNITERGFGFSVQLLIEARQRGLTITEVPISCSYHPGCHSLNPVVHGLSVAFTVAKLRLKGLV